MWERLLHPEVEEEWPLALGCWLGLCLPAKRWWWGVALFQEPLFRLGWV